MPSTYQAVQVTKPGLFELVQRELVAPGKKQVRIRVEACGVCHSDAATVEPGFPGAVYPRVPGHEVVGTIDALGDEAGAWQVGQRVGVGFLAGHCGVCLLCRAGDFVNCTDQPATGLQQDGGYAEMMIARISGLVAIPDELSALDAAPLLCAGLTTFNALRNSGARAGELVAVQGLGGLGHLGVQFARHMGFKVVAIARGPDKAAVAKALGAHLYVDSLAEDPALALKALGGARVVLATGSDSAATSALFGGLKPRGKLIAAGVGSDALSISPLHLLFGSTSLQGTLTGSALDNEETLAFSVLQNIRPTIEVMPLAKAAEAYARMLKGHAKLRIVLQIGAR